MRLGAGHGALSGFQGHVRTGLGPSRASISKGGLKPKLDGLKPLIIAQDSTAHGHSSHLIFGPLWSGRQLSDLGQACSQVWGCLVRSLSSLALEQASSSWARWQLQGSKRKHGSAQSLLRVGPGTSTLALPPYPVGQSKSQGQLRFMWGWRLDPLSSHIAKDVDIGKGQGCGYLYNQICITLRFTSL